MERIILASGSSRRKEILRRLHIPFRVIKPAFDEKSVIARTIEEIAGSCAEKKVENVARRLPTRKRKWVLGVDTLIELEKEIIGKPKNRHEAASILKRLSGKIHRVVSGIALLASNEYPVAVRVVTSAVKFKLLSDIEIQFYIKTGEWQGVAGAYRIQERGAFFVEWINGSYSNIVGLPISDFYDMLRENNYSFSLRQGN
ncbi:MAG: septum formation protein Maf [Spirochaetales bacterium]|nr:septum formation protein Maf [Spirochaetales bacterium]